MSDIQILGGDVFSDYRGSILHCNEFDMEEVRRFYCITHPDIFVVRAWHAHQNERKWFVVLKGSFTGAFVKIDDWESPSSNLTPEIYTLTADKASVLCIPKGYANGFKALEKDSVLMVYSDKVLSEALLDSWRYDAHLWIDWSKY